jgi:hypothetical protein
MTKICEGCGVEFEPSVPSVRFHSRSCARSNAVRKPRQQQEVFASAPIIEKFLEQPEMKVLNHMIRDRVVEALKRVL